MNPNSNDSSKEEKAELDEELAAFLAETVSLFV